MFMDKLNAFGFLIDELIQYDSVRSGVGQEEVLDDEFALDLGRRLHHGVRMGLEVDL